MSNMDTNREGQKRRKMCVWLIRFMLHLSCVPRAFLEGEEEEGEKIRLRKDAFFPT